MCVFSVFVLKALKIYCLVFEWRRLITISKRRGKSTVRSILYLQNYFICKITLDLNTGSVYF